MNKLVCCKCGIPFNESEGLVAIDPPGVPNRRWKCYACIDKEKQERKIKCARGKISIVGCGRGRGIFHDILTRGDNSDKNS